MSVVKVDGKNRYDLEVETVEGLTVYVNKSMQNRADNSILYGVADNTHVSDSLVAVERVAAFSE